MKISILTPDFSHNCFGRAWLLAKVLQRHYDVEVVGPVFGEGIWKPLDMYDLSLKTVKGCRFPGFAYQIKTELNSISGDIIYVSKPLMPSFGIGLIKKFIDEKPLVIDIDDLELGYRFSIFEPRSYFYTTILSKCICLADKVTVSSKALQAKYGGTIVYHGRDVTYFNPARFDRRLLKERYLSGQSAYRYIVGFIGTPRPHKGVEDLITAIELLDNKNILLIIVGIYDNDKYCNRLEELSRNLLRKNMIRFFPLQPFDKIPELLSIIDLVVISQRKSLTSTYQVPAKLFDAMAMAKPIIATKVSDLADILRDCGWIVEPNNPSQLAQTIQYVYEHSLEAEEKGWKARKECEEKYSWDQMEKILKDIFHDYE